ncbi:metal ABC transporter solute-binding protein, Zn/Mn family [Roseivirga misakiensis]|uniref:Manganese transporter n=1 Tax=Roseivirga misakiensis TaxID=1563681 RepID=A0A1E5SZ59_9BACT|nr:zinc ABC transporter substrate-binding protein [Roseivirga misakiensis]OEK04418.1 manganese transporter [Roseivirga misakiensis]
MKNALILFICSIFLLSCGKDSQTTNGTGKLAVVATTGMIADIVRNVGKDSVTVTALMGPGVDPHLYKATQGDLGRLRKADVIFYNGLHLEGKMGEVFEKLERIKTVVPIARAIEKSNLIDNPVFEGSYDPHIWFDVSLWLSTIKEVTSTLSSADPESKSYYEKNAQAYEETLAALHQWVITEVQKIPEDKRLMVTAHDAFSYFGRAYNIEVRGLQGISTLSEFGLKDRVDLVNFIVERKVKAVFVETSVSEKNINAIVEGCRQKGHEVMIGGNLFSDAMGAEGTPGGDYIGMVKTNVTTIVNALK